MSAAILDRPVQPPAARPPTAQVLAPPRRAWRARPNAGACAVALGAAGALWLHQALLVPEPTRQVLLDRALFLAAATYALSQVGMGARAQWRRRKSRTMQCLDATRTQLPLLDRFRLAGAALLAALILAQTLAHLDERAAYLYMTRPGFPVGAGSGADGYVFWLEGHPTYEEAWQFAQQAGVYNGAEADFATGDHDARAAYSYLAALLARPLGYFGAFVTLNVLWWLTAALATWYLGRALLGREAPAFAAALLTAGGQGFVAMAGTPMSYVAGYAWGAVLLALAVRWQLFAWQSRGSRWLAWGWLCGVAGTFYFTHVVLIAAAWLFGLRRTRLRHLGLATTAALAIPATWYLVGHYTAGLRFKETTAQDLVGSALHLLQTARRSALLLPSEAGDHSAHALAGGYYGVLAVAAVGLAVAAPRRRAWYLAVTVCGLAPAFVLHMIPVTQRYGYLAYPAIHIAAAEGAWYLGRRAGAWLTRLSPKLSLAVTPPAWGWGALALVSALQLAQSNADLWGVYRFALAFGAP